MTVVELRGRIPVCDIIVIDLVNYKVVLDLREIKIAIYDMHWLFQYEAYLHAIKLLKYEIKTKKKSVDET